MLKVFKTKLLPSGAHSLALLQRSEKQESSYEARSIDLRGHKNSMEKRTLRFESFVNVLLYQLEMENTFV